MLISAMLQRYSLKVSLDMVLLGVFSGLILEGVVLMLSRNCTMYVEIYIFYCSFFFCQRSEMQSEMEGTLFFEPLHQESFMLELQSLVKYELIYAT